jgi:hypothetical protein
MTPLKWNSIVNDGSGMGTIDGEGPVYVPMRIPLSAINRVMARIAGRKWPLGFTLVTLVLGLLYMFFWNPVVHHVGLWAVGGDAWGIWRAAHYVGWGDPGGIYTPANGVVTLPGLPVLLAPLAMLSGKLHLTESVLPFFLPRPTAALLLQPAQLLLGSTVLFGTDALAERLGVSGRRRIWLCAAVMIVAWPVSAAWGHAEDLLALTFALYAVIAAVDGNWKRCGWLFGFGICMQPLVALMVPLFIGNAPSGRRLMLAVRSAAISVFLVGIALVDNAANTYTALVKEPTPPAVNHPTPWVWLAPHLPSLPTLSAVAHKVGGRLFPEITGAHGPTEIVAAGPGRTIYLLLAIALGFYVWRRPQSPMRVLWLADAVLGIRCFFEAVMTPYYLGPPLIFALIVASTHSGRRFWASVIVAFEIMVVAYNRLSPWAWWLPVVVGMSALLALGYPAEVVPTEGPTFSPPDDRSLIEDVVESPVPAAASS